VSAFQKQTVLVRLSARLNFSVSLPGYFQAIEMHDLIQDGGVETVHSLDGNRALHSPE
jgi:hypothetical protein